MWRPIVKLVKFILYLPTYPRQPSSPFFSTISQSCQVKVNQIITVMADRKSIFNQTRATWVCLKELNQYIRWIGLDHISYPAWVIISYHDVFYSPDIGEVIGEWVNQTAHTCFFFVLFLLCFLETWKNICGIIISLWIGRKLAWFKCMVVGDEATELDIEGVLAVMPGGLYLVLQPLRRQWESFNRVMMWLGLVASCS